MIYTYTITNGEIGMPNYLLPLFHYELLEEKKIIPDIAVPDMPCYAAATLPILCHEYNGNSIPDFVPNYWHHLFFPPSCNLGWWKKEKAEGDCIITRTTTNFTVLCSLF